jgi:hypothetical protein
MPTPYIEMAHRVGYEHREQQERGGVEDELGDEDRPQQRMMQHEGGTFPDLLQRMAARRRLPRGLIDPRQQHHRDDRQRRGETEGGRRSGPSHQHAAERRA